ncbi:hypothetical protein QUF72_00795 [Desulfobacterales bacterium HSG2]|nr:hypothetical protein [Desulfobacterales bacterium HSG2]
MRKIKIFSLSTLILILGFLLWREESSDKASSSPPDSCGVCHESQADPSPSHPVAVLGCACCHLGNPFAGEKDRAHLGLAANPGDMHFNRLTCGQKACHPDLPQRVEQSLMATNRGILKVMQSLWPHDVKETVQDVRELTEQVPGKSLALDHYRKMCGGCHLWRPRYPALGEIGRRGGGCTDCHISEISGDPQNLSEKKFRHPELTTRIPNENCLKCHNRSARIGLSYMGRFESEGYGTPFQQGGPGQRRLSGRRFYLELPPDVHHKKAGMDCIDCHTEKGVMGDGKIHTHQEQQVDIRCETCHEPETVNRQPETGNRQPETVNRQPETGNRLIRLNQRQPPFQSESFVISPKGSPLYHLRVGPGEKMRLYRKRDGREIPFKRLGMPEIHKTSYHKRLSCQACHSAWIPQCYGCHETLFLQVSQKDWLTGKKRPGRWVEGRSYLRFRRPSLGIWPDGSIGPFAPGCQVFLEAFDASGNYEPDRSFRSLIMASFDPHTTALKPPACSGCHLDPKVLGLGEGYMNITRDGLEFEPVYQSRESGLGIDFPPDAFVSPEGEPLQQTSRPQSRPFNKEELKRITQVSLCLPCHDRYGDPIYEQYERSLRRFWAGDVPCRKK